MKIKVENLEQIQTKLNENEQINKGIIIEFQEYKEDKVLLKRIKKLLNLKLKLGIYEIRFNYSLKRALNVRIHIQKKSKNCLKNLKITLWIWRIKIRKF